MKVRAVIVGTIVTMLTGSATVAFGQTSCLLHSPQKTSTISWSAPLDRAVTLRERDLPLRTALERIASAARLRLSYSADLLPSDRRICVDLKDVAVGTALSDLLTGIEMQPIAAGADQVVLAPSHGPTAVDRPVTLGRSIGVLERVVVTGTADGAKQRSSPFALDVLDGRALSRSDASSLMQAFDASVAGLWMWSQAPTSLLARYGSVRGASSFGVSTPKIYVDGIEVANPLLLTHFDPDRVDRVEVIRGPQGAALYGADAISGVVNIISRHDAGFTGEQPREVRTRAGVSSSEFMPRGAFVSDHAFTLHAGNGQRSMGLGLSVGTLGQYVPGANATQFMGDADVRRVGSRSVVTGILRFSAKEAGTFVSPLLSSLPAGGASMSSLGATRSLRWTGANAGLDSPRLTQQRDSTTQVAYDSSAKQSIRQYTLGTTATFMSSTRWTHTAVAGIDGYRLHGLSSEGMAIPSPSPSDSALASARGGVDRTTLRFRSVAHFGDADASNLTVTLAAEHSATREQTLAAPQFGMFSSGPLSIVPIGQSIAKTSWWATSGALTQLNANIRNQLFLTAGGRVERSSGAVADADAQVALLPMLGAAVVHDFDGVTVKFRSSYGTGIRPTRSVIRGATSMGPEVTYSLSRLSPEKQSGYEVGTDVIFGRGLALHVTRFDQTASGLIQPVAIGGSQYVSQMQGEHQTHYELQNVGAISNRGWELQATSRVNRLNLTSAWTQVDSRVAKLALGYGGDLRTGDRMLEVPRQTLSLTAGWVGNRWATSWTTSRAFDWINYDRLALAKAQAERSVATAGGETQTRTSLTGAQLRSYWLNYQGETRIRGNVSFLMRPGMSFIITGDNLLGQQRGEPDNITVIPGRTLTFGLKTGF